MASAKYIFMDRIDGVNARLDGVLHRRGMYPNSLHGRGELADYVRSRRTMAAVEFERLECAIEKDYDEKPLTR